jgi:hypothetical protein
MFEIHLDTENTEASVARDEQGVIRLTLSPSTSLEAALSTCRDSLTAAVCAEFELIFADREVVREFKTTKTSVIIRRG